MSNPNYNSGNYHSSNGSYYYKNSDGSTYYNNNSGTASYTIPSGHVVDRSSHSGNGSGNGGRNY
ncbi:hypothetical protein BG003_009410 [Podila horticola]|nr:hypothetical protein BG003_009410 [Podila horticola]